MSIAASLLILGGSIVALLAVIMAVRRAGQRWRWHHEVSRKAVHVAIGLYALVLPLLFDARWPVVLLVLASLVLMAGLRRPRSRAHGLGATIHSVARTSWGDIWLALAIGFVFLRSEGRYILYALPMAVIALSDAAAALTGTSYGRRRFAIENGVKSWEGVVAFFAVTLILALVMLLLLTDVPRVNVVVLALAVAVFAATVEAVSWRGLDNLFVPIATQLFLAGWLYAAPLALAGLAAAFFTAVLAIALVTPRLGVGVHASRTFVVAAFVFLGTAGVYGTVLPALVVGAHLLARRRRPCKAAWPDLDVIATLCAAGLIWFFVGETVGPSAINLWNLTATGMILGYLSLATLRMRWAAPVLTALVLATYAALVSIGPAYGRWIASLPGIAVGSLAVILCAVVLRPAWFDRWRAPRLAGFASLVPMTAYLSQTVIA